MACWWVAYLLAVVSAAESRCFICQPECLDLPLENTRFDNLTLSCQNDEQESLANFIESHDFTKVRSLTLRSKLGLDFNVTRFYNISYLNLSGSNISSFNVSVPFRTILLNLSNSHVNTFTGEFPQLLELDLSNNLITNFSLNTLKSKKLINLHMQNNIIRNITNLTSASLMYLSVQNNNITSLRLGRCPSLKELDISFNNIREINASISYMIPNVEILNLSANVIQELKDYSFNLTNLLKLDLKNNSIHILSQNCFYGLNRLQYLDISLNMIQTVAPSTFQYLNGLIHLVVSDNNEMNSQDFGLLLATRRLKSVHASRTNQKKIPSSLTRSVRYLVLSYNIISQIQCGDLDSYPLLNSLGLANNNISYIEDDALGRLDFLVTLNLDSNFLSIVPHTLPNNLKNLYLRNNMIKSISSTDFTEMQQLLKLDLAFNKIKEIKEDSFSQLLNLENLNLSGNNIITLPTGFTGPRKLRVLDLSYLLNLTKCEQTLCFPVPEYNDIQELYMKNSSNLVKMFMKDVAALKTFKQLMILNVANSNLTSIRKDLPTYLPRLNELHLEGNRINCSEIQYIFTWSLTREVSPCVFLINDDHMRDEEVKLGTIVTTYSPINVTTENPVYKNTTDKYGYKNDTTNKFVTATTEVANDSLVKTTGFPTYENKSEFDNFDSDYFSNEIWFKNESPGMVDAFSSETPTSHPGLFILLLLPIALVSTCLFINYSRIKRTRPQLVHSEMDIEISNISSELW